MSFWDLLLLGYAAGACDDEDEAYEYTSANPIELGENEYIEGIKIVNSSEESDT